MSSFTPDTARGYRHELIAPEPDCPPYLERWVLNLGPFAIRLHHFFRSDEAHLHDHPWWFAGIVLAGVYVDVSSPTFTQTDAIRCQRMRPGRVYFRRPNHTHRVITHGVWTLLITGRKVRDWGFWVDGTWVRQRRYFRKHASHACD